MQISVNVPTWALGILVGGIALASLTAFKEKSDIQDSIRTKNLELVDNKGNVRARLTLEKGHPTFTMSDENGVARITIVQDANQSGVFVSDKNKDTRIGIAQFAHGGGGVALHGPGGKGAAVLHLKGQGSLSFYEVDGEIKLRIPDPKKNP